MFVTRQPLSLGFVLIAFICGNVAQPSPETLEKRSIATPSIQYPKNDCNVESKAAILYEEIRRSFPSINGAFVVDLFEHCTRDQRVAIVAKYNAEHHDDFLDRIERRCEFLIYYTIASLARSLPEFWARELNWAVKGPGTNEEAIIQILTPLNNAEITQLKQKYEEIFKRDLRSDLLDDISGDFAAIVDSQLQGARGGNNHVNRMAPSEVAEIIRGEGLMGTLRNRDSLFFQAITQLSFPQLRKVDNELLRLDYPIQDAIKKTFSGWHLKAYSAIVTYAESKVTFFADELKRALDAKNKRAVIRIRNWRVDIDLNQISAILGKKYRIKLWQ